MNDGDDDRAARVLASFLVARAAFGLTYLAAALQGFSVPWYAPIEHVWTLASRSPGHAMGWYGLTAVALVAAVAFGVIAYATSGRASITRWLARPAVILAVAHAGALVLMVDFVYFGWTLTHQAATPWPQPSCPDQPGAGVWGSPPS
jgi:hypothetical protein